MNALCGWLAPFDNDNPPGAALDAMAKAYRGRPAETASVSAAGGGLWVAVTEAPGTLYGQDEPWAAIVGSPTWSDPALAEEQAAKGAAAALRRAYHQYGLEFLERLHGAFALAIVDPVAQRLILAIDRLGLYSLYYSSEFSPGLVFGTTAGFVKAHPGVECSIAPQAIYGYLHTYGIVRAPATIYREQKKLLPAQFLLFEKGQTRIETYWQVPFAPDRQRSEAAFARDLMEQMRAAVDRAIPAEPSERVGAFLSGGLDSSTVVGLLNERTSGPATTFTIGFDDSAYDEMRYAEATTKKFGTHPRQYYLTAKDTMEMAPKVAGFYDEPFGNSSAIPTYFCARQAQQEGFTCLLAGDGGDEIFAGNSRYVELGVYDHFGRLPAILRNTLKFLAFQTPVLQATPLWRKAQRYIERANTPLPERLEAYNFFQPDRLSEIFEPDALTTVDPDGPWRDIRKPYESTPSENTLHRMMHMDLTLALADNDLRKVTGMCELAGISVRYPFLDEELVNFAATIPPELLIKNSKLRYFFKEAFKEYLPREVIEKKKHGFGMPFYEWTRNDRGLRELAYDNLESLRRRQFLRSSFIDTVMAEHAREEQTPYDALVWDLMMLELWLVSHQ